MFHVEGAEDLQNLSHNVVGHVQGRRQIVVDAMHIGFAGGNG